MMSEIAKTELSTVLDTIVDGVIVIDGTGRIERYNPSCEKIFGYKKADIIGQNINILMPEPYHGQHDRYISNYKTTGEPKIIGIGREVKGKRQDGSVFPMYLSVGELPRQTTRAFVGIIRDLTRLQDQQKKYSALQQDHFHLSRVAAMDQMGAAIAHELNQPLTAIMNYLEAGAAILDKTGPLNEVTLKDIMTKSAGQADRAAKILSRLRRFIETGDTDKKLKQIDSIIKGAVDLIRPSFKNDNIDIVLELDPNLPDVLVSEVQIQQVFVNLLRNACEALREVNETSLRITAIAQAEDEITIGVIDTGVGMSDAQYEKLYEPFSSNKLGGLGVGLSISQSIISNHEGRLWVERNLPQGTCFYFTLPVANLKNTT